MAIHAEQTRKTRYAKRDCALPILIGATARRHGIQKGFRLAVASAVGLTVTAIVLWRVMTTL